MVREMAAAALEFIILSDVVTTEPFERRKNNSTRQKTGLSLCLLLLVLAVALQMCTCVVEAHGGGGLGMAGGGGGMGGVCRTGTLSCASDKDCWKIPTSNGSGNKNNSSSSSGGGFASQPHNCKCCTGYPFHPQGECRSDCRINPDLYLAQLHGRLALMQNGGVKNGYCSSGCQK